MDSAVVGGVKPYAQANLLRAHAAILTTLLGLTSDAADDGMAMLLDALSAPLVDASPMGDVVADDSNRWP